MASRGLHHCGKFLEPSDEWAGRGCYCFLMQWHSWYRLVFNKMKRCKYIGRLELQLGRPDFFCALLTSFNIHSFVLTFFHCFLGIFFCAYHLPFFLGYISILLFPCASVRKNTRAWVPHFYSHAEYKHVFFTLPWSNLFLLESAIKLQTTIIK